MMPKEPFRLAAAGAALLLSLAALPAGAATITTSGVRNLRVGSAFYDVAFKGGSCAENFSGCNHPADFDFTDFAVAQAAMSVLSDVLNGAGLTYPAFAPDGCTGSFCNIVVPFAISYYDRDLFVVDSMAAVGDADMPWSVDFRNLYWGGSSPNVTFADWTYISAVPEPAAALLLGAGLCGLAVLRRREAKVA